MYFSDYLEGVPNIRRPPSNCTRCIDGTSLTYRMHRGHISLIIFEYRPIATAITLTSRNVVDRVYSCRTTRINMIDGTFFCERIVLTITVFIYMKLNTKILDKIRIISVLGE